MRVNDQIIHKPSRLQYMVGQIIKGKVQVRVPAGAEAVLLEPGDCIVMFEDDGKTGTRLTAEARAFLYGDEA
jgi:hypothetical protein